MKRRLLIIAIFLLLGAVVNVALIGGLARYFDPALPWSRRSQGGLKIERHHGEHPGDGQYWVCVALKRLGTVTLRAEAWPHWHETPLPVASIPHWSWLRAPQRAPDHPHMYLLEHATGRPILAMVYRRERFAGGPRRPEPEMISMGLPTEVIWPEFLVNTLFHGGILWLLLLGPFALRRFLRLRRGLCPKCAYPMGESAVCTECGGVLPSRIRCT